MGSSANRNLQVLTLLNTVVCLASKSKASKLKLQTNQWVFWIEESSETPNQSKLTSDTNAKAVCLIYVTDLTNTDHNRRRFSFKIRHNQRKTCIQMSWTNRSASTSGSKSSSNPIACPSSSCSRSSKRGKRQTRLTTRSSSCPTITSQSLRPEFRWKPNLSNGHNSIRDVYQTNILTHRSQRSTGLARSFQVVICSSRTAHVRRSLMTHFTRIRNNGTHLQRWRNKSDIKMAWPTHLAKQLWTNTDSTRSSPQNARTRKSRQRTNAIA